MEMLEVGAFEDGFEMGFVIGERFSRVIKSRLEKDAILKQQLLPFANHSNSNRLLKSLSEANKKRYPKYWDELRGIAQGSGASFLEIMLVNFRKEILPFIEGGCSDDNDDCSDVVVVGESMAVAAHNEDANVALLGHTYLIKGMLPDGHSFTAYTYAGELPTCAFGFNTYGLAFTLNSVPPCTHEMQAGAIGRNFISRDLLQARSIDDALQRICSPQVSVGHTYNLMDVNARRILNVETASRNRHSVYEVGPLPFFHANMYLHLQVEQVRDESSLSRQTRAGMLPRGSTNDFLSLLGDNHHAQHPIYMSGPLLHTLCTVVIDLDQKTVSIIQGNPKETQPSHLFSIP